MPPARIRAGGGSQRAVPTATDFDSNGERVRRSAEAWSRVIDGSGGSPFAMGASRAGERSRNDRDRLHFDAAGHLGTHECSATSSVALVFSRARSARRAGRAGQALSRPVEVAVERGLDDVRPPDAQCR